MLFDKWKWSNVKWSEDLYTERKKWNAKSCYKHGHKPESEKPRSNKRIQEKTNSVSVELQKLQCRMQSTTVVSVSLVLLTSSNRSIGVHSGLVPRTVLSVSIQCIHTSLVIVIQKIERMDRSIGHHRHAGIVGLVVGRNLSLRDALSFLSATCEIEPSYCELNERERAPPKASANRHLRASSKDQNSTAA